MVQPETFNNQKSPPLEDGAKVDEAAIKKFTIDNGPAFARGHQMSWRVTAVIANDKAGHRIFRPNRRRIISSTAFHAAWSISEVRRAPSNVRFIPDDQTSSFTSMKRLRLEYFPIHLHML
jgi:hypothetical protein